MKKYLVIIPAIIAAILGVSFSSCGSKGNTTNDSTNVSKDLNLSIFLDLSDRLIRDMTPNQMYRDTAIINMLCDYFKTQTLGPTILKSQNKIKVFFYPAPKDADVAVLANSLSVDIGEKKGIERRKSCENLKANFSKSLTQIYNKTIEQKNWVGCDIWDFFSSGKVDQLCVKKNARNIIVILTDGYLFTVNNKKNEATAYNYILPQTLDVPNSSLLIEREDLPKLDNLEVLMLEINPYIPKHTHKMKSILQDWYKGMGVKKFVVAETDANISNTQTIINTFLNNE